MSFENDSLCSYLSEQKTNIPHGLDYKLEFSFEYSFDRRCLHFILWI